MILKPNGQKKNSRKNKKNESSKKNLPVFCIRCLLSFFIYFSFSNKISGHFFAIFTPLNLFHHPSWINNKIQRGYALPSAKTNNISVS